MRLMHRNLFLLTALILTSSVQAETDIYLTGVPDYTLFAGAPATACANLAGYWDRHGLDNIYTGSLSNGIAPLSSSGANADIRFLWASTNHLRDYWASYNLVTGVSSYESTALDRYVLSNWVDHVPDCIADFIGASQRRWAGLNGECDGNIDGYAFVYWDATGERRANFVPPASAGSLARDLQSGLREWMKWLGYDADVFSQLADFNPNTPPGKGFSFTDLRREIDSGFPVLLWLQATNEFSRPLGMGSANAMPYANPRTSTMLAYGYYVGDDNSQRVHVRTSLGNSGSLNEIAVPWTGDNLLSTGLPVRGVIGFHPKPRIGTLKRESNTITFTIEGGTPQLYDNISGVTRMVSRQYIVERTSSLELPFAPITIASTNKVISVHETFTGNAFFRVAELVP
jgi:hypothetical protein